MATTNFIQSFRTAAGQAAHPHLEPINAATFQSDHALALAKASNLIGYQKYLAAARSAKAQRKGVSLAFERDVQAQASNALDDLQALCGGTLRLTQQVNHTDFWSQSLTRMASTLGSSGPVTAKQIWAEVQERLQNPQYKSALEAAGLTDDVTAALMQIVSQLDASLVLRDRKVSVETQVAGESQPRRLALMSPGGNPSSIVELLGGSQFDQVVSAFSNGDPVYIEAAGPRATPAYQPSDLFGLGAVAARQRMANHVRKLEDTGLATYQGNDPVTVAVDLLIGGSIAGVLGFGILYLCNDPPGNVTQPDWVCDIGYALVFLACLALGVDVMLSGGDTILVTSFIAWELLYALLFQGLLTPGFQGQSTPI